MEFRIADTFTDALARLPAQEQKAVKTSAFDLQLDPSAPGLQFHRIDRSKDPNFWSIRVNRDIRIIIHKTEKSLLLAYVDHHDKAYAWAERRRIEAHPKTGAIQIVEVRELIEDVASTWTPTPLVPTPTSPPVFERLATEDLLSIGVPADWIDDLKTANEDRFLDLAGHLPTEAAEALLSYVANGILPPPPVPVSADPFAHPDALRRIRVVENADELEAALEFPWEKWTVFLHPSQRALIDADFEGPARVVGSAGTGKTIVAIHRAVRFAQGDASARVLLATFSRPLAATLDRRVRILLGPQTSVVPRIRVASFNDIASELYQLAFGRKPFVASDEQVRTAIEKAIAATGEAAFSFRFLMSEWTHVIDAWQLDSVEAYATVPRLGRKNRMGPKQREKIWSIMAAARKSLHDRGFYTWPQIFTAVTEHYRDKPDKPFTHVVVDEAQDLGVPEFRMMAAISRPDVNGLFFTGDLGQRIFQQPFSWSALGVDVQGRSATLRVNYRTSHQIREASDALLPKSVRDVDDVEDGRAGTVSVFNGPAPTIAQQSDETTENQAVADFVKQAMADGYAPAEIGVFVRSRDQIARARSAVQSAGVGVLELSERSEEAEERVSIGVMHLAKGLEFKAVAVMACDDDVVPLQSRIETATDETELDDVYNTERHLFYVACTRARDRLHVSGVTPASEFMADLIKNSES
ncbi:MAG: DNA helicase [Alphaproteobacteria bacterium]|nr:MAG: DNA helicase [Alphaproteobacteria bacterium]